jgi:predicted RNase H-like nuclease (RuvC/YqgF family)
MTATDGTRTWCLQCDWTDKPDLFTSDAERINLSKKEPSTMSHDSDEARTREMKRMRQRISECSEDLAHARERIDELEAEMERLRSVMEKAAWTVMNRLPPTEAREQTAQMLRDALDGAGEGGDE